MRSDNEKKSIVKSVKLSPSQVQQIEEKADKKGMKFSEYMLDCALHGEQGITPEYAVKMQELVNMVLEFADTLDENEYQHKDLYRQKASAFAEMFAPVNPVEKLNGMKQQINNILKGGEDIWESLK
ncbi:MAG: plasmid mobilization protein [Ruminococcus sp.]